LERIKEFNAKKPECSKYLYTELEEKWEKKNEESYLERRKKELSARRSLLQPIEIEDLKRHKIESEERVRTSVLKKKAARYQQMNMYKKYKPPDIKNKLIDEIREREH